MKFLDTIRVPYATANTVKNSTLAINNYHLKNDYKEDDQFISSEYQDQHEKEPLAPWADYHCPKNSSVI